MGLLPERFAATPQPPYYVVAFTNQRTAQDASGYGEMAQRMVALAAQQPGYLGVESVRDEDGFGITLSYWDSLEHIAQWKNQAEHQIAQVKGKSDWYEAFFTRIAKVERAYAMLPKDTERVQ